MLDAETPIRDKLGKISTDLLMKESAQGSVIDLEREAQNNYYAELLIAIERGKIRYPHADFFIHVETKLEKLLVNVTRNYFFTRSTCPTPFYDQSVYHYKHADEQLQYLWTVPCKDACFHLLANARYVVPEEQELLRFVLAYESGDLLKIARKLNHETSDLNIIITKKEEK